MCGLTRVHDLPTLPEWPRTVDCIAQIPRVEPNMTKKKILSMNFKMIFSINTHIFHSIFKNP